MLFYIFNITYEEHAVTFLIIASSKTHLIIENVYFRTWWLHYPSVLNALRINLINGRNWFIHRILWNIALRSRLYIIILFYTLVRIKLVSWSFVLLDFPRVYKNRQSPVTSVPFLQGEKYVWRDARKSRAVTRT